MNQKVKFTEDFYLKARVADRRPISCYLGNGTRLQGTIVGFDQEAIFMKPVGSEDDGDVMMVYKVQVASVSPDSAKKAWRTRSSTLRDSSVDRAADQPQAAHAY